MALIARHAVRGDNPAVRSTAFGVGAGILLWGMFSAMVWPQRWRHPPCCLPESSWPVPCSWSLSAYGASGPRRGQRTCRASHAGQRTGDRCSWPGWKTARSQGRGGLRRHRPPVHLIGLRSSFRCGIWTRRAGSSTGYEGPARCTASGAPAVGRVATACHVTSRGYMRAATATSTAAPPSSTPKSRPSPKVLNPPCTISARSPSTS
jgi:hypothetical protein